MHWNPLHDKWGPVSAMTPSRDKRKGMGVNDGLARIHRRDTAVALTRGMMGTGRRTGRARSRSMGLRVVRGGHASGQVVAGSGGGRRKRPGGMPEVALAGWAGMSLRDSPWGCPVDGSGADGAPSGW